MPVFKSQITLKAASGQSKDNISNSFHWQTPDAPTGPELAAAATGISEFYTVQPPDLGGTFPAITGAVYELLSNAVAQNGHVVKIYEADTPAPHLPLVEATFDFPNPTEATALPEEVAICLSLKGDTVAGTDSGPGPHLPARHRNRTYIGPIRTAFLAFSGSHCRVDAQAAARILSAYNEMQDALFLSDFFAFIWSPTRNAGEVVQEAWVDDSFDTIRKRGGDPSGRWTIFPS